MEAHLHGDKKLGTSEHWWEVLEMSGVHGQCWTGEGVSKGRELLCVYESAARAEGNSILL